MKRKLKNISSYLWTMANVVWFGAALYYSPMWWKLSWWSVLNGVLIFSAVILFIIAHFMKTEETNAGEVK
jgi:hypothetical protein